MNNGVIERFTNGQLNQTGILFTEKLEPTYGPDRQSHQGNIFQICPYGYGHASFEP
jgi:hypothetical protein